MNDALQALRRVLDEPGLKYFAVGSVASSIHGLPRFTQHVDLVVDLSEDQLASITNRASGEFYLDADEALRALWMGRAFNLIHFASAARIDVFPLQTSDFHRAELARSGVEEWVVPGEGSVRLPVASAEDIILSKLRWYRQGGEVSDKQWSDLLGVATAKVRDWKYLREWAPRLGVADLLERLLTEAGQID